MATRRQGDGWALSSPLSSSCSAFCLFASAIQAQSHACQCHDLHLQVSYNLQSSNRLAQFELDAQNAWNYIPVRSTIDGDPFYW
jgi:membrane-bound inhibitor of C-type lysozyme